MIERIKSKKEFAPNSLSQFSKEQHLFALSFCHQRSLEVDVEVDAEVDVDIEAVKVDVEVDVEGDEVEICKSWAVFNNQGGNKCEVGR